MRMNGPYWKLARLKLSLNFCLPSALLFLDDVPIHFQACFPEDFIMGENSVRLALSHLIKTSHSSFFEASKMTKPVDSLEKHTLMKNKIPLFPCASSQCKSLSLIAVSIYPRKA